MNNVQMCRCANVQIEERDDLAFFHLHICTSAHLHICKSSHLHICYKFSNHRFSFCLGLLQVSVYDHVMK